MKTNDRKRCAWTGADPLLIHYHDREWGRTIGTDAGHLERMTLEIFQCGLSWRIVLVKREALREAFDGFDVARVARMGARDVRRLMTNPAIIRNRAKIDATIANAGGFLKLAKEHGSYLRWFKRLPTETRGERDRLFDLLGETFRFMGPETTKCYLMGCGKIPAAHDRRCWLHGKGG